MTITELEARATARVLGRTMVEPCDAITVRVLCSRLREAIRVAKRHIACTVLAWTLWKRNANEPRCAKWRKVMNNEFVSPKSVVIKVTRWNVRFVIIDSEGSERIFIASADAAYTDRNGIWFRETSMRKDNICFCPCHKAPAHGHVIKDCPCRQPKTKTKPQGEIVNGE